MMGAAMRKDVAVCLFLLGLVILNQPFLTAFEAVRGIYIYGAWALLIGLTAWLAQGRGEPDR